MQRLKNLLIEKPLMLISFVWLLQNIFIFSQYGIVTRYEATKYIEQATHFLNTGHYTSNNFLFYSVLGKICHLENGCREKLFKKILRRAEGIRSFF